MRRVRVSQIDHTTVEFLRVDQRRSETWRVSVTSTAGNFEIDFSDFSLSTQAVVPNRAALPVVEVPCLPHPDTPRALDSETKALGGPKAARRRKPK